MANKEGTSYVYERRGKGSKWRLACETRDLRAAQKAAESLLASIGYGDQQARIKNVDTGRWVRNGLFTREVLS